MAYHDKSKLSREQLYESEEGEIEDDISPKSESFTENSTDENSEETLAIKPPPAKLKSEVSSNNSRKERELKHKKYESHRREHHDHKRSRSDSSLSRDREPSRKRKKELDYHNNSIPYRERPRHREDVIYANETREIRLNKNVREHREERPYTKQLKNENPLDSYDVKKREWREKRLNFMERKREQNKTQPDDSRSTKESLSNGKDLRDKLKEQDRLQRQKRLERFRSPPKDAKVIPSSIVVNNRKSDLHHISPEPITNEEAMENEEEDSDLDDSKNEKKETESDTNCKSESEDSEAKSDTDSKDEASGSSSDEEDEESEDSDSTAKESPDSSSSSETEEEEDEKRDDKTELVETTLPSKIEPAAKLKEIFSTYLPAIQGCRSVDEFNSLSRIEEGTYGVVYRATEKATGDVVALKRLKMEKEKEGFPITSLREINTLLKAQHENIVSVREIVVGSNIDRIYIVMDYVEHDLKSLMKTMKEPFSIAEVKMLMLQLLRAVAHLHDNWILHRDLKPSNLLLSNNGTLKVGDFGLAREYGSPLKSYTPVVVTLWYRAPELLLGAKKYSTAIDVWSVGCIFGELLTMKPLFPGEFEMDQLKRVFKELGTPSEKIWPGFNELPLVKKLAFANYPYNRLKHSLPSTLSNSGFDLINRLLTYYPGKRITAEKAISHEFFDTNLNQLQKEVSDKKSIAEAIDSCNIGVYSDQALKGGGFSLKF